MTAGGGEDSHTIVLGHLNPRQQSARFGGFLRQPCLTWAPGGALYPFPCVRSGTPEFQGPRFAGDYPVSTTLLVLDPTSDLLAAWTLSQPDPGTILIADLDGGIPVLADAVQRQREVPWCPLVMRLADPRFPARAVAPFESVPGSFALLYPSDFDWLPPAERIRRAVARRPVPQLSIIACWLELRLGRPGLASTLGACFGAGDMATRPPRTLTRRLKAIGPLEVRDWRGLARLAQLAVTPGPWRSASLETTALDAGIDPRTLRRWLRLCTDLSWSDFIGRVGWEWVLESALRRLGALERSPRRRISGAFSG